MTRSIQTTSKMALSSLLLSTALAACTVGPDYTPPKAELALFHNLVDASCRIVSCVTEIPRAASISSTMRRLNGNRKYSQTA